MKAPVFIYDCEEGAFTHRFYSEEYRFQHRFRSQFEWSTVCIKNRNGDIITRIFNVASNRMHNGQWVHYGNDGNLLRAWKFTGFVECVKEVIQECLDSEKLSLDITELAPDVTIPEAIPVSCNIFFN